MRLVIPALIVMSALVLSAAIIGLAFVMAAKRSASPSQELVTAVRLLDRVAASDDAMPQLPAGLRTSIDSFLGRYHKEIEP